MDSGEHLEPVRPRKSSTKKFSTSYLRGAADAFRPPLFCLTETTHLNTTAAKMLNRSLSLMTVLTFVLLAPLSGCSDPVPTSVTEDADQAAIDAWKAKEAAIADEGMEEMEE